MALLIPAAMLSSLRALSPLAPVLALPLLLAPLGRPGRARAQARRKPAPAPAKPTNDIIPLPLTPILPVGQRLCTAKTTSGLGCTMLRPGAGAVPTGNDYVLVNYIGYLAATGAVFDQGQQAAFEANAVIPGFSAGLQMLAKGGIARFCIPAAMGYGAQDAGAIPPNSDLVFQVEMVDFKSAAEVEAMRKGAGGEQAAPGPALAITSHRRWLANCIHHRRA
jgi:FKBP-type peptidyl-prolyl cis-trans isomerase FkpA